MAKKSTPKPVVTISNLVKNDQDNYTMIRQPYRITMAKWSFTPVEKRILTKIVSRLQQEITQVERGTPYGQLALFQRGGKDAGGDSVEIELALNDLVKNSNNYSNVKKALRGLRNVDVQIELPAVAGKKSKIPAEQVILTGLIERATIKPNARTVKVVMHRETAKELVTAAHGLTSFAEEIMFLTDNSYTQKMYELLSHWKDKEVYSLSPDDFRHKLSLEDKYPQLKDLIRRVIKPAEEELKTIGDIYFEFSTTKSGVKIIKFNFVIKHRKTIHEVEIQTIKLREDTINMLRIHFKFKEEHFAEIEYILGDKNKIKALREKIAELAVIAKEREQTLDKIVALPQWTVKSLKNYFEKDIRA